MSPGNELRAARLRELCQSLVSDEAKSRFGQLFHAAIRSDDAVLQSIIDKNCGDDATIPPFIGEWVHDDKEDWGKSFSLSELLARSNSEPSGATNNSSQTADARAFRHRLWEIVWQAAICGPGSQIKGFRIQWSEWACDVTIDGRRWSSCIVGNGDESLDDDLLYERLEELGNLVRSELHSRRTVDQPNGYNCAIAWIELVYSLFPQPSKEVQGVQTVILPWNLADASARAIEVLMDRPEWRFGDGIDANTEMQPLGGAGWPPDEGWHFRTREAAFLGMAFEIGGKQFQTLKTLAEARRGLTIREIGDSVSPETDPLASTIRGYCSEVRMLLRQVFIVDRNEDGNAPIIVKGKGDDAHWLLDSKTISRPAHFQR
jgi:hypothetical protein